MHKLQSPSRTVTNSTVCRVRIMACVSGNQETCAAHVTRTPGFRRQACARADVRSCPGNRLTACRVPNETVAQLLQQPPPASPRLRGSSPLPRTCHRVTAGQAGTNNHVSVMRPEEVHPGLVVLSTDLESRHGQVRGGVAALQMATQAAAGLPLSNLDKVTMGVKAAKSS